MLDYTITSVAIMRIPTDFRKGPFSLLALAYRHNLNPYKGDCVVFMPKHLRAIKVLCGDRFGLWLLERRFEGGRIVSPWAFLLNESITSITVAELGMLLSGQNFESKKRVNPFHE
jgi:hypothetical protein